MKILWVLVHCGTERKARAIGDAALEKRLASCFDIFSRRLASYFWPPKKGRIERARGSLLVLETTQKNFPRLEMLIRSMHTDALPFIGSLEIGNVSRDYVEWVKGELK